jgi:hypothetical protein
VLEHLKIEEFDLFPGRILARNANVMETDAADVEILDDSGPLRLANGFNTTMSMLEGVAWRPEQIKLPCSVRDPGVTHDARSDQRILIQFQPP